MFSTQYHALLDKLCTEGQVVQSRTGPMYELISYSHSWSADKMPDIEQCLPDFNWPFAEALADSLLDGEAVPTNTEAFSERSLNYLRVPSQYAGNVCATYGPKLAKGLEFVLEQMRKEPNTRRAYIPILTSNDQLVLEHDELAHLEYPCTIGYTFVPRMDTLSMVVHMRAQEAKRLLPLDSYLQYRLLQLACHRTGLQPNSIHQHFASVHCLTC